VACITLDLATNPHNLKLMSSRKRAVGTTGYVIVISNC
jgi:hypothetical protein